MSASNWPRCPKCRQSCTGVYGGYVFCNRCGEWAGRYERPNTVTVGAGQTITTRVDLTDAAA